MQVIFVVPAALLYDLTNRVHDGVVQRPSLACAQIGDRMPGMQTGSKKDILGDRIPQSRDDLVLGQQPLRAPLLSFYDFIHEGTEVVEGELGLYGRGPHSLDVLPVLLFALLVQLHGPPHLSRCGEKGVILERDVQMILLRHLSAWRVIQHLAPALAQQQHVPRLKRNEEPLSPGPRFSDRLPFR